MTPQGILEDMDRFEALAGPSISKLFDAEGWQGARDAAQRAVHFEFSGAEPTQEQIEFGDDIVSRGLFRLPFDLVLYTPSFVPKCGIAAAQWSDDKIGWYVFDEVPIPGERPCILPVTAARMAERGFKGYYLAQTSLVLSRVIVAWDEKDHREMNETALRVVLGCTALMMSKDVDTRTEAAPDKPNRRREEQGRPLIRERRIVTIKTERRAFYAGAAAQAASHKSSPRMHWRRGHFRQLQSGAVIPVAPSIVNADISAQPLAKQYRVQ